MGLSASQARLLNLTARMHDIEYKAQNLEAQKLQMANESRHVYQEYEDALNKQKVQFKQIGPDGSAQFVDADLATLLRAGYEIEILSGNDWNDLLNAEATLINAAVSGKKKGDVVTVSNKQYILTADATGNSAKARKSNASFSITDPQVLRNLIEAGFIVFKKPDKAAESRFVEVNIATDTNLQEVTDEVDLKKAEAKYEADMRRINNKDKKFDTDLAALDNERTAIKAEMETLKSVAKENVDRTFKLFS